MAVGNFPSPATGGRVWVFGARIATPAPGLLKVPGRLEFAMCVRPQPFEGAPPAPRCAQRRKAFAQAFGLSVSVESV